MRKRVKNGPQSTHMRNIMLLVSSTPTVVGILCRLISEKACTLVFTVYVKQQCLTSPSCSLYFVRRDFKLVF
jgi:hypothetical protein